MAPSTSNADAAGSLQQCPVDDEFDFRPWPQNDQWLFIDLRAVAKDLAEDHCWQAHIVVLMAVGDEEEIDEIRVFAMGEHVDGAIPAGVLHRMIVAKALPVRRQRMLEW